MSINNIQQNLLQAIDLIAINQASAVNFDTTEIATVLSKLENGNYWVSNGKVKYEAKSTENVSYIENTQVYVSISQGDYSQDKVIIGRYDNRNEDEKAYLYEDPFERLGVSQVINVEKEISVNFIPTALGNPTLLGIETSVTATEKGSSGYYGLQIQLLGQNDTVLMKFIIDSRNFIGNPYNMVPGIKQKHIFSLPSDFDIISVQKIKVEHYGDTVTWASTTLRFGYDRENDIFTNSESKVFIRTDNGNNTYGQGNKDSYKEVLIKRIKRNEITTVDSNNSFDDELNTKNYFKCSDGKLIPNIGILLTKGSRYKIKLKYFIKTSSFYNIPEAGIINFPTASIKLNKEPGLWHEDSCEIVVRENTVWYSKLSTTFIDNSPEPYIYLKDIEIYELQSISLNNLYFSWVKDRQVYSINNPTSLETLVSWYKYTPNHIDEDLGIGWEKINNENAWTLDVSNNYLDHNIPEERFRARLVYNDVDYLSNILVLKNKDYVGEIAAAVSPTMTLRLNDDGIYLYDHTAQLYETEKTLKTISASSNAGFEDDYRDLYWLIPKNSTMIAAPRLIEKKDGETEYWYWDYLPDIHFSTEPTDFTSSVSNLKDYDLDTNNYYIIGGNGIKFEQNIYIKRSYQPNYLNNTIQCKAFFGDTSTPNEEGSVDLKFVSANNNGVEASLGIELVSEKGYLGGDNEGEVEVKGVVYDKNGIPFKEQPNDIKFTELDRRFYNGNVWIPGGRTNTDFYDEFSNTIQVQKDSVQLIFCANSYGLELNNQLSSVVTINNSPRIFSVRIEVPDDSDIYSVEIIQDEIRDRTTNTAVNGIPNLYLVNDPWHINKVNNVYYSKSKKMTIHYVYDDAEWDTYTDDEREAIIPYQSFNNIPALDSGESGPMSRFTQFEQKTSGGYTIRENKTSLGKDQKVIQYELDETITEVYIRINKGFEGKYCGCLPYINFRTQIKVIPETGILDENIPVEDRLPAKYKIYFLNTPLRKASCTWNSEDTGKPVQLTSYYQIPYFPTSNVYQLDGPTKFTYSSFGNMPYPSAINKYKLFDSSGKEISDFNMFINTDNIKINNHKHTIALPELAPAEESFYILDIKNEDEELIAQYPISLLRNTYAFKEINAWGGSTVTAEDYIISPMIGAGSKNASNQFTGIIMGTNSEFPSTGLYGFKDGVATFGFKEDGSCFMGANEETGRIEFNTGSNGNLKIISNDFNLNSDYIDINKQNGISFYGNTAKISFSNTDTTDPIYLQFNTASNGRSSFLFKNNNNQSLEVQINAESDYGKLLNLAGSGFNNFWLNPFQKFRGLLEMSANNDKTEFSLYANFDSIDLGPYDDPQLTITGYGVTVQKTLYIGNSSVCIDEQGIWVDGAIKYGF